MTRPPPFYKPSAEELDIMRHALGFTYSPRRVRNYFLAALDDSQQIAALRELERRGLMQPTRRINEGKDQYFVVTDQGEAAVRAALPPSPKLTRAQLRYQRFLRVADVLTFRQFLDLDGKEGLS